MSAVRSLDCWVWQTFLNLGPAWPVLAVQPKCKQIFKIACQTQQMCDLVSDKKWLRL